MEKKLNFQRKKTVESEAKKNKKKKPTDTEKEMEENKEAVSLTDSDCKMVVGGTNSSENDSSDQWGGGLMDEGDVDIT